MGIIKKIIERHHSKKEAVDFRQPETVEPQTDMADKVKDDSIEMGLPLNESAGKKTNMGKVAAAGFGMVAIGALVAGLIGFTSGSGEETDAAAADGENVVKNLRPNDFNKDKSELALQVETAASEPVADLTDDTASVPAVDGNTSVAATEPAEPQPTPAQLRLARRLGGEVLLSAAGKVSGSPEDNPSGFLNGNNHDRDDNSADGYGLQKAADDGNTSFAARLNPTATAAVYARHTGDRSFMLGKGTNIRCALETKIVTTQPGLTRCQVMRDIYSANGKVLLLERGSQIIGEQTAALVQGQARVFVLWNEVETPNGVRVSIASPGAGALGEAGHGAWINYHFWQRFGGAMLISLISDVGDNLANRSNNGDNNHITYENSSDAAQQMAAEALRNSINIPPTGTINQGTVLNVMVARDVDFGKVYEVVKRPFF